MTVDIEQIGPLAPLVAPHGEARLLWIGPPIAGFDPAVFALAVRVGPDGSVMAAPDRLPFADALFDRVILNKALIEGGERAQLREVWRVLAPAGQLGIIVPAALPLDFREHRWRWSELELLLSDAMFDIDEAETTVAPRRRHLARCSKRDGLRPALVGRLARAPALKPA
jgi:SAM-dependent methyltransferase